jgi:hypothetical protein
MRFVIALLAAAVVAPLASAQQTNAAPRELQDAPKIFEFNKDQMQLVQPPGLLTDGRQVFRLDDQTLQLVPVPRDGQDAKDVGKQAQLILPNGMLKEYGANRAPAGKLCQLRAGDEVCDRPGKMIREPFRAGDPGAVFLLR